jgi:hypothetical protein
MSTDDILDQIDHAVRDYEMSPDAMRWSPEKPEPPAFPGSRADRIERNHARIDERTIDWAQIGAEMSMLQEAMVELVRAGNLFLNGRGQLERSVSAAGLLRQTAVPGDQYVLASDADLSDPPGMVAGSRGEARVRRFQDEDNRGRWQDEVWNVTTSSSSDDSDH